MLNRAPPLPLRLKAHGGRRVRRRPHPLRTLSVPMLRFVPLSHTGKGRSADAQKTMRRGVAPLEDGILTPDGAITGDAALVGGFVGSKFRFPVRHRRRNRASVPGRSSRPAGNRRVCRSRRSEPPRFSRPRLRGSAPRPMATRNAIDLGVARGPLQGFVFPPQSLLDPARLRLKATVHLGPAAPCADALAGPGSVRPPMDGAGSEGGHVNRRDAPRAWPEFENRPATEDHDGDACEEEPAIFERTPSDVTRRSAPAFFLQPPRHDPGRDPRGDQRWRAGGSAGRRPLSRAVRTKRRPGGANQMGPRARGFNAFQHANRPVRPAKQTVSYQDACSIDPAGNSLSDNAEVTKGMAA